MEQDNKQMNPIIKVPEAFVPDIELALEAGPAKASFATKKMGGLLFVEDGYTWTWSASSNEDGLVRCVNWEGDKDCYDSCTHEISARLALPPSVTSAILPSDARDGEYYDTPYEGIVGNKRVDEDIAGLILRWRDKLPKTGKEYVVFDREAEKIRKIPEVLLDGKKYAILNENTRSTEDVFEITTLRVKKVGEYAVFEYTTYTGPINIDNRPYTGNMDDTDFGRDALPGIRNSYVPSNPTEEMIEQSYKFNPKNMQAEVEARLAKYNREITCHGLGQLKQLRQAELLRNVQLENLTRGG